LVKINHLEGNRKGRYIEVNLTGAEGIRRVWIGEGLLERREVARMGISLGSRLRGRKEGIV
jgi:hypothetical protein